MIGFSTGWMVGDAGVATQWVAGSPLDLLAVAWIAAVLLAVGYAVALLSSRRGRVSAGVIGKLHSRQPQRKVFLAPVTGLARKF